MKTVAAISLALGLTAIVALLAWRGFASVGAIFATMGAGVLLLPLIWLPHVSIAAISWRMLFAPGRGPRLRHAAQALWVGHGLGTLLPLAGLGDEVVKARVLVIHGTRGADAAASVVVDKTVQAASLLLWGLIGAVTLSFLELDSRITWAALAGLALLAAGIAGFIAVQRARMLGGGVGMLARLWRWGVLDGLAAGANAADDAIRALYRRPRIVAASCGVRLIARIVLGLETVLAAHLMGQPIGLAEAVVLRSLTTALRGAMFVVPNGLGVQEGGFIALGAVMGYPPEFMLALSLATRARELIVGVPGALIWQRAERRKSLAGKAASGDRRT